MACTSCSVITIRLILCFLLCMITPSSAQAPTGFLSIDCGSSGTDNYTDTLGIGWAPDAALWPDINAWSSTAAVSAPAGDISGFAQYQTLRYFPPVTAINGSTASSSTQNPAKFCYTLPAKGGQHYLVRATFWYGTAATASLYETRAPGIISFRMIVDTYTGPRVSISIPQSVPVWVEMYVHALDGSSSLSVCFSGASSDSDAPFVNALELRPLPATVWAVKMMNNTSTALFTVARSDFGASADAPSTIRYPYDTLDRLWLTSTTGPTNKTSLAVTVEGVPDLPPIPVLQTSFMASTAAGLYYNISTIVPEAGEVPNRYHVGLFFAEIDPRVNASGLRVFDVSINGEPFFSKADVFATVGLYTGLEIYSPSPLSQPNPGHFLVNITSTTTSIFPPFIAGVEILQLFSSTIAPGTSSIDVMAIQEITSTLPGRFRGDPCLPAAYKYPWINCTADGITPTRVLSISLSNVALAGSVPASITDLDELQQILLDGNSLEGSLPTDFSNLVNLRVLNLSNNKLSGAIPDSLAALPRLTVLDLANNNFSGVIPLALQQKASSGQLTFKYDGNSFLCLSGNATCKSASSSPSGSSSSRTPLIIGVVVGVVVAVLLLVLVIFVIFRKKNKINKHNNNAINGVKANPAAATNYNTAAGYQEEEHIVNPINSGGYNSTIDSHVVISHTKVLEATKIARSFSFKEIITATNNFSTVLGRGGFGYVYKGTLTNGVDVAVKVLSDASQQGEQEFLNEVSLLSRVYHKNLVGLLGYCTEKKLVLVYEFMSNGSLFDSLFGSTRGRLAAPLEWIQRLQILLDAAQGLAYLHHGCSSLIIHRDVKSSNILMNASMEGKMSDFGISKLKSGKNGQEEFATKLIGSAGYLDPEFARTLILTEKIDIYSFGVVLFEAICGKPPLMELQGMGGSQIHIIEWARPYYQRGAIEEIIDENMGNYNVSSVWTVAEMGMACTQAEGRKRPTMNEVCSALMEALRSETNSQYTISPPTTEECTLPLNGVRAR